MTGKPAPWRVALDVWQAQNGHPEGLARRRQQRLTDLVAFAGARSAFYRRHYSGLPDRPVALESLPPVSKPQLMAAFDDWITDPALGRAGVDAILANATTTGVAYRDGLFACTSSGTTGQPGIFVHDCQSARNFDPLSAPNNDPAWCARVAGPMRCSLHTAQPDRASGVSVIPAS